MVTSPTVSTHPYQEEPMSLSTLPRRYVHRAPDGRSRALGRPPVAPPRQFALRRDDTLGFPVPAATRPNAARRRRNVTVEYAIGWWPPRASPRCCTASSPATRSRPPSPSSCRGRSRPGSNGASDRGAVTVEAALALCSLTLVTALALAAIGAAAASVRCTDAARELVRLAARGEPDHGRAVAARLAPAGARIELTMRGDEAAGEVIAAPVRLLPVHVVGRAVAVLEPGAVLGGGAVPAGASSRAAAMSRNGGGP